MSDFSWPEIGQVILVFIVAISALLEFFFEKKSANGKFKPFVKVWIALVIILGIGSVWLTIESIIDSNRQRTKDETFQSNVTISQDAGTVDHIQIIDTTNKISRNVDTTKTTTNKLDIYNDISDKQKFINDNRRLVYAVKRMHAASHRFNYKFNAQLPDSAALRVMSAAVTTFIDLNLLEIDNPVIYKYPLIEAAWKMHIDSMIQYQWYCDGYNDGKVDSHKIYYKIFTANKKLNSIFMDFQDKKGGKSYKIINVIRKNANLPEE